MNHNPPATIASIDWSRARWLFYVKNLDLSGTTYIKSPLYNALFQSPLNNEDILSDVVMNLRVLETATLGYYFLTGLDKGQERRFFSTLGDCPSPNLRKLQVGSRSCSSCLPSETMRPSRALLDALPQLLSKGLNHLHLHGVQLNNRRDVELLAQAVRVNTGSLRSLELKRVCNVDGAIMGLLDPILLAISESHLPQNFALRGYADDPGVQNGPSLITAEALRLTCLKPATGGVGSLGLTSLGLGDEHCKAIAEGLVGMVMSERPHKMFYLELDLKCNPNIGEEGYIAILGLLNRNHRIRWAAVGLVDDFQWNATFNLVFRMNTRHGRGEFLRDGTFDSRTNWVNWLARLARLQDAEIDEATQLNYLWYTLLENPDFCSR
jgi:hypothetical protein